MYMYRYEHRESFPHASPPALPPADLRKALRKIRRCDGRGWRHGKAEASPLSPDMPHLGVGVLKRAITYAPSGLPEAHGVIVPRGGQHYGGIRHLPFDVLFFFPPCLFFNMFCMLFFVLILYFAYERERERRARTRTQLLTDTPWIITLWFRSSVDAVATRMAKYVPRMLPCKGGTRREMKYKREKKRTRHPVDRRDGKRRRRRNWNPSTSRKQASSHQHTKRQIL